MSEAALGSAVADFLYREAQLLDERRWAEWLALYAEDAVFWVPAVTMRGEPVSDPELSVNLIYIAARAGLEDRIFRIETRDSLASTPLPRTCHMIGNVRAATADGGAIAATAAFQVAAWSDKRGAEIRHGRYEYLLRRDDGGLCIARKKVLLLEEVIDGWFDVISI